MGIFMRQELDEKLCRDFPLLYSDRNKPMRETAMCWGFQHGDGWFDIIYDLSSKLEPLIQKLHEQGADCECGHPHTEHCNECECESPCLVLPRASTVKEKFGTLRFYMWYATDEMDKLIRAAEAKSARTCEECGQPGKLSNRGNWLSTKCEKHDGNQISD